MLRSHSDKAADYRRRLDVLVDAGILELPDLKDAASRGRFICRESFDELSFLFLCAWEVTCGHLAEDLDVANEERRGSQSGPGSDHPHKKLVNFLALKSLGFANLRFHYLSILPAQKISAATSQALENTEGFAYWCLGSSVPDIEQHILLSLETGLDPMKLRGWHRQLVDHVEQSARNFAAACLPQNP